MESAIFVESLHSLEEHLAEYGDVRMKRVHFALGVRKRWELLGDRSSLR